VDGGLSWQDVTPVSAGFRDVFFIDAVTGWIAGASIYKTTDGGTNWTKQFGDGSSEFTSISFFRSQNGWLSGLTISSYTAPTEAKPGLYKRRRATGHGDQQCPPL